MGKHTGMTSNTITLSAGPSRLGWKCPECHACHSPDVTMCTRCAPPYCAPQQYAPPYQLVPYEPTRTIPYGPWWGIYPPYGNGYEIISTVSSDTAVVD